MKSTASLLLVLLSFSAYGQDPDRGRLLYENYCGGCHYERVHDRLRTEIQDLTQLRDMVARWAPHTRYRFTPEEKEDVVEYLNRSHYRIGLDPLPRK